MAGGNDKYNNLFDDLCGTMNRRLLRSKSLNLPTYPNECIYVPDMLVAIVALNNYSKLNKGKYISTVRKWVRKAKSEWLDKETGLLVSFLSEDGIPFKAAPVKGSYSALNCLYLTQIDSVFAREQYHRLKSHFCNRVYCLVYGNIMIIRVGWDLTLMRARYCSTSVHPEQHSLWGQQHISMT